MWFDLVISLLLIFISAFVAVCIFYSQIQDGRLQKSKSETVSALWILLGAAFLVRFVCFFFYPGHDTDMNCFNAWSDQIYNQGFSSFYTSDMFADYPPGYIYILYVIGFIKNLLGCSLAASYILLKLPAVICDILCGYIVYILCKKNIGQKKATIFSAFFLFNPAVIFNSSIWGQVDSVFTLFILLMLYCLNEKKMYSAYFSFAVAVFIKPQALFYAPVLIFGIIENVFLNDFSKEKFFKNLLCGISAILAIVLLSLPFGIESVINQYKSTIASYNYVSVNAYNLWTALGLNWATPNVFNNFIGYLSIVVTIVASAFIFFSKNPKNKYFFTSAFICFSIFVMSIKMHERYAFPSIALMLCACCISLNIKDFFIYLSISALQFLNMVHVLFYYNPETFYSSGFNNIGILLGLITVALLTFIWIYSFKNTKKTEAKNQNENQNEISFNGNRKITRTDLISLSVITIIYSAVALYNLGDRTAPQTFENITPVSPVTVDFEKTQDISEIMMYLGPTELSEENTLVIEVTDEIGNPAYQKEISYGNVFFWNSFLEDSLKGKSITISASKKVAVMELAIKDNNGELIMPLQASKELFDEQETVPKFESYRNSTYFDEIYHARTAYEFENSLQVYEWTHPPLGKFFISLGIKLFGMTPFGWRIVGTIFGILMIPVIYIFLKKMFGITWLSTCASLLFSFDFMHFTQTRIATIDVYVTFFIMLMYLFMYKYYITSPDKSHKKTLIPLGISGISMGLAIACKWTGVYAGAGLAVIFFISLYNKYKENASLYKDKIIKTVLFCVFAFGIIPVIIYIMSYIPFMTANGTGFSGIIQNQIDMLTYHGNTVLDSTHPFSSSWYQWPINYRPIWYYSGVNGIKTENISAFGNPLVWWSGIVAFIYTIYDAVKNKNKNAIFLTIAYLAQLVPWIGVTRITFIYHYFPSVPFVVLMIAHLAGKYSLKNTKIKTLFIIFTALAILLFMMFYPVISGYPVSGYYVRTFLKWLPSWQLIN